MGDRNDDRPAAYEPPRVEDVDMTQEPAETASGVNAVGSSGASRGVEESERWH